MRLGCFLVALLAGCGGAHVAAAPASEVTPATGGTAAGDGAGGEVRVVPPASATPERFASGMDARVTDGKWLYGFAMGSDAIVRVGPFGGTPTLVATTATRSLGFWWTLAVDDEMVYWSDSDGQSRSRIWRAAKSGGTAQLLADVAAGFPLSFVVHDGRVYYNDGGLIEAAAGGTSRLVAAGAGMPVSVDDDAAWVVHGASYPPTALVDRVRLVDGTRTPLGGWVADPYDEWPQFWLADDEALYAFSSLGEVHRVDKASGGVEQIAGGPDDTRDIGGAQPTGAAVADGQVYRASFYPDWSLTVDGLPWHWLAAIPTVGPGGRMIVRSHGADAADGPLVVWGDSVYYTGGGGVWRVAR
jgi:hypothetical protein